MDTLHPLQIERFREMSFQEKFEVHKSLLHMAWNIRLRAFQKANPDWDEDQCGAAVAREFTRGRPGERNWKVETGNLKAEGE